MTTTTATTTSSSSSAALQDSVTDSLFHLLVAD
jgi:hypothetical protein